MYFWVITTLSLIACIVVFLLSPVEDRNKRLDEKEHHVYHIRAIVVMTIEAVAVSFTSNNLFWYWKSHGVLWQ